MKKKIIFLLLLSLILTACGSRTDPEAYISVNNGLKTSSRIIDNNFQVYQNEKWIPRNIKSVNLKNYLPGINQEVSKERFEKWIEDIANLNANTIKLDDLFPSGFYQALDEYNRSTEDPIYIIQTIPMDLTGFEDNLDPFKLDNSIPFKNKISTVISALHGDVTIPKTADKDGVSGEFSNDVSTYVAGLILGSNWPEEVIKFTNDNRQDKNDLDGTFVSSQEAKPFEIFLAEMLEHSLQYEFEKYSWARPIGISNKIRDYRTEEEGLREFVTIDPDVIKLKNEDLGYFVAYDIFSSQPSYVNTEPNYTMYLDHRGKTNNYSGFLNDFIGQHETPILVGSFGAPSSRGLAKVNTSNLNQGQLSEKEQGEMVAKMYEDIIYAGALGGSIESWQDDWTKATSNIEALDNANRRKLWSNSQNPGQHFGLVSFGENKIDLDGLDKDWTASKIDPIFTRDKDEDTLIEKLYIDHDHQYLYFALEVDSNEEDNLVTNIMIDTIDKQGNSNNPFNPNISTPKQVDFLVNIDRVDNSKILVDSYYDTFDFIYNFDIAHLDTSADNSLDDLIAQDEDDLENPEVIAEDKSKNEYKEIKTGLLKQDNDENSYDNLPVISFETGRLVAENSRDNSAGNSSLADYCWSNDGTFLELRIPWALMNFSDPSSKEIIGDFYTSPNGLFSRINIEDLKFALAVYSKDQPDRIYSLPNNKKGKIDSFISYKWESWNEIDSETYFKDSYEIIQDLYKLY